jgi:ABC-type Na+ transport system ATPase subunit NatA
MPQGRAPGTPEFAPATRARLKILRATDVTFSRDGVKIVAPFSLVLEAGQEARLDQPSARAAAIAARICAAIVRPTSGIVYVGEYETRLQPPQAKRLVGFVDADGFEGDAHALRCEVAFRADVWNVDKVAAQLRASAIVEKLGDGPYARALALALVADVALVVLDRPPGSFARRVRRLVPEAAILHTHVTPTAVTAPSPQLSAAR